MSDFFSARLLPVCLASVSFLSYLLFTFSNEHFLALTLIPAEVFVTNNRVWTFISSPFLEGNLARLIIDVILLFLVTSPRKVAFDIKDQQFGLYLVSNTLITTFGTFMWLMIRFFGTDSQSFMTEASYGCGGIIIALAMYARRYMGSSPVVPQFPAVTFDLLPTILVSAITLLRILRFKAMTADIIFIYFSYFSSWTYLNYLYHPTNDTGADISFAFIGMFPEAMHPVVLPLSIAVYNLFSIIGVLPKIEVDRRGMQHHLRYHDSRQQVATGDDNTPSPTPPSSNSGEDLIAERRRAKAIKLLDAKMAELSKEPEGWEDLKDEKSKV